MNSNENIQNENIGFWAQVKEDFVVPKQNDPALESTIELFLNYPGVWAIIHYRVANRLYKRNWKAVARFISGVSQFLTNIDIHPAATIGRRVFIDHGIGVVVGATTIIEDDVLIYQGVTLGGVSLNKGKRHPTIKSNCVIGSGAKVLGNIIVGENSKIGANSVVISDVPANCTAAGIPARTLETSKCSKKNKENSKLSHDEMPDITKDMFLYLIKRVETLEKALREKNIIDMEQKNHEFEEGYKNFVQAVNKTEKK